VHHLIVRELTCQPFHIAPVDVDTFLGRPNGAAVLKALCPGLPKSFGLEQIVAFNFDFCGDIPEKLHTTWLPALSGLKTLAVTKCNWNCAGSFPTNWGSRDPKYDLISASEKMQVDLYYRD
jgi:hypothetical protein